MTPIIGEIRAFAGTFAPVGWALCNGNLLSIAEYETLYTLLGTTYGGDGQTSFGLPNLCGRTILSQGQGPGLSNRPLGSAAGTEGVSLTSAQLGSHSHSVMESNSPANAHSPANTYLANPVSTTTTSNTELLYLPSSSTSISIIPLDPTTVGAAGGNLPHENRMPFVAITYIIATQGIYPSQN